MPRKLTHSQNFLKNPEFVGSLIEKTDINDNDLVVEIGPGKGIITRQLVNRVGRLIGVEVDSKLVNKLRIDFRGYSNVEIIEADFLKWKLPSGVYKVVANIPFNMTADVVTKLLEDRNPPEVAYLIIQDKAAERFIGKPVARDTQMSILLQPWFEMEIIARIDRRQFTPVPNINVVLVMFKKKKTPLVEPQYCQLFRDFVVYGYNQWQPTILDAFKKVFTSKQRAILAREIGVRAAKSSDLNIDQWLELFGSFMKYVPQYKKELVKGAEQKLRRQQRGLRKMHRTRSC